MEQKVKEPDAGLHRRLGLSAATLAGIGVILGAGIYVLVGVAAKQSGNAVWLSFLIAAIVAGFTGLSYARLGRLRPKNAPEFQYLNMAFGRTSGFLAGWLVLWSTIISSAAVALGFAGYLEHLFGLHNLVGAMALIIFSSVIVFLGAGESVILAGILTLVEASGLVIIIGIGVPSFGRVDILEMPMGMSGVIASASLVFFAYLGFEGMANLSEEMKNPERDLPRALLLALGISTVFYILVAVAAVSVLGWQDLSQSGAPLAAVASKALGAGADLLLTAIALASTANTVLLLLFAASRSMWAMSCAGVLPMNLCVIGKNRRTPWLSIIVVGVFASVFALVRDIQGVAEFTNFAILLAFAGVNASAFRLFVRDSSAGRMRHVLRDWALPVVGCLASLWLAMSLGLRAALFGLVLVAVGVLTYLIMKRFLPKTQR